MMLPFVIFNNAVGLPIIFDDDWDSVLVISKINEVSFQEWETESARVKLMVDLDGWKIVCWMDSGFSYMETDSDKLFINNFYC